MRKYFKNPKMTVENMKSVSKAGMRSVWIFTSSTRLVSVSATGETRAIRASRYGAPRGRISLRRRRRDGVHTPPTPSRAPRAPATLRATSIVTRWRPWRRAHAYPAAHAISTRRRAGTGLLVWVTAISKYFDVAKNVGPRVA